MQPEKFNAIITTGIIVTTTIYLIISYITIRINFKPILDWAHQQGGNKFKNKVNMFNIVAFKSNPIIYYISNYLFTPVSARLTSNQTRFILNKVLPNQTFNDENDIQQGIVTMRSLAISVLPDYDNDLNPDVKFNTWVDKIGTRGGYRVSPTNTKPLLYTSASLTISDEGGWRDGSTIYSYYLDKSCLDANNHAPLWPAPDDTTSWKGLIFEWLNGPTSTTPDKTSVIDPKADNASLFYWVETKNSWVILEPNGSSGAHGVKMSISDRYQFWFGKDNKSPQADNWIARMGMPYDSVLITGYVNNQYSLDGVVVDAQAFQNLIGGVTGDIAGGWVGFVQGLGENVSSDALFNLIQTTPEFKTTPAPPHCHKSAMGGLMAFLGPVLSAGMFVASIFDGGVTMPMAVMGTIGLAQGGMAAYQSQQC